MTKLEAYDYLKGTKVVLKTEDEQVKLQEFLFSIGYKWSTSSSAGTKVMKMYSYTCMFFISSDGYIKHSGYEDFDDKVYCDTHAYKELKIEDILGLEIDEDEKDWKGLFRDVRDTLKDKQIMVLSKDNVMIIDL